MFVIFISKQQPPTAHCNERKYFSFDDELHLPAILADVSISKHLPSSHIGADTGHCTLDGTQRPETLLKAERDRHLRHKRKCGDCAGGPYHVTSHFTPIIQAGHPFIQLICFCEYLL